MMAYSEADVNYLIALDEAKNHQLLHFEKAKLPNNWLTAPANIQETKPTTPRHLDMSKTADIFNTSGQHVERVDMSQGCVE